MMNWRLTWGDGQIPHDFFVMHEGDADKDGLKMLPMGLDFCERSLAYVANEKLPFMLSVLEGYENATGAPINHLFMSGHQVILGMVPALIEVLGDRASFVRLRRNKFDTAYSYVQKNGGPCTHRCHYCLCPMDAAARMPPVDGGRLWDRMSVYQQYLWFVDEVEAQWQAIVHNYPQIRRLELDWDKKLDDDAFRTLALFVGFNPTLQPRNRSVDKRHTNVHKKKPTSTKNYTWMVRPAAHLPRTADVHLPLHCTGEGGSRVQAHARDPRAVQQILLHQLAAACVAIFSPCPPSHSSPRTLPNWAMGATGTSASSSPHPPAPPPRRITPFPPPTTQGLRI